MYNSLGAGWSFVLLSGICVAGMPISFIVIRYGRSWREAREARRARKAAGVSINLGDPSDARGAKDGMGAGAGVGGEGEREGEGEKEKEEGKEGQSGEGETREEAQDRAAAKA